MPLIVPSLNSVILFLCLSASVAAAPMVALTRLPENNFQPQAVVDIGGVTHLIYLQGNPASADIFYQRRSAGELSAPLRVNHEPGSAIGIGTIRGPQLSVGAGVVHVSWNGRAPTNGTYMDAPMLYTRMTDFRQGFERERNLITAVGGLDGGGTVAADEKSNVLVFWHAPKPGNTNGEAGRALYVARSHDKGATFSPEVLASTEATGACACCGSRAFIDAEGHVFALFRSATDAVNRDEILLGGAMDAAMDPIYRHSWKIGMCPMSSASFASRGRDVFAAWESRDNVFFSRVNGLTVEPPLGPEGKSKRKHPSLAVNAQGSVLLAWSEGTSWGKGGSVAWQVFDRDGHTVGSVGSAQNLPAWSLPAAVARPDGTFEIFY